MNEEAVIPAAIEQVIKGRRSIRAYFPAPVDKAEIEHILLVAACAPSGANMQPWRVRVVTDEVRDGLVEAVCAAFDTGDGTDQADYAYYPKNFFEPYLSRRRKVAWGLYGLLGIVKGDTVSMKRQHRRNFEFFGAPVGLIFSIDRRMGQGSWLDFGMFLQNIMLAAHSRGLATCPQASWIHYRRIVSELLSFGEHEQLVCGMALGYADRAAPENSLVTERVELRDFVEFC